jgi:hypothetical protein
MPSDQEFLLYPLDTGEDPACMDCGTLMMVAGHEVRDTKPDFTTFRCKRAGAPKSMSAMNEAQRGSPVAPFSRNRIWRQDTSLIENRPEREFSSLPRI